MSWRLRALLLRLIRWRRRTPIVTCWRCAMPIVNTPQGERWDVLGGGVRHQCRRIRRSA